MSEISKMNPSTYIQVRENMEKLMALVSKVNEISEATGDIDTIKDEIAKINEDIDKLGDLSDVPMTIKEITTIIEEINNKILNPEPDAGGDLINTEDGVKVIGIHANTTDSENDTAPNAYKQGMTLELKKASAVGLSDKEGINKEYVFVLTFVQDSSIKGESAIANDKYSCQQVAYADIAGVQYSRTSSDNIAWSDWAEMSGSGSGHIQWVESTTEPVDQLSGDYWCEPLDVVEEVTDPTP